MTSTPVMQTLDVLKAACQGQATSEEVSQAIAQLPNLYMIVDAIEEGRTPNPLTVRQADSDETLACVFTAPETAKAAAVNLGIIEEGQPLPLLELPTGLTLASLLQSGLNGIMIDHGTDHGIAGGRTELQILTAEATIQLLPETLHLVVGPEGQTCIQAVTDDASVAMAYEEGPALEEGIKELQRAIPGVATKAVSRQDLARDLLELDVLGFILNPGTPLERGYGRRHLEWIASH